MALRVVLALGIVGPLVCLAVPRNVLAQEVEPTSDAANRASAEAWFREYIEPVLSKLVVGDQGEGLYVPLEPPWEHPSGAAPEKRVPRRLGALGPLGMLVLDVDVPQQRGDWNERGDWNDAQPKMFRLYFEPTPAPTAPSPTLPNGHAPGA
jgi:hypothetical protein